MQTSIRVPFSSPRAITTEPARDRPIQFGTIVGQRFEICDRLRHDGVGEAYRAYHLFLRREVQVRIVGDAELRIDHALPRLQGELRRTAAIAHPNLAQLLDAGVLDPARIFVVSELCQGETLAAYLTRKGPLSPARALGILRDVARGLRAAHERDVVHGDLRPSSVVLTRSGNEYLVKVLDLGLSERLLVDLPRATPASALYRAPERVEGQRASARSDVYSLGALLLEMLSGRPPEPHRRPLLSSEASALPLAGGELALRIAALLHRCLAVDPAARPADAGELLRGLHEVLLP